ncbi:MAG TPA: ISAs1 family transposase [Chitinophagales bacterium]|nr:ISAs1 family transposase [Chitinophagales bacterium]
MKDRIEEIFCTVPDPRVVGRCLHKLSDILMIALCTLIADGEDFEDMVVFCEEKEPLLRNFLELPNGIPSHDTINRVLQIIDYQCLDACLGQYGKELLGIVAEKQICIDGKKLKGVAPTKRGNAGLFLLSAWVSENRLCIGQTKVEDKSNEITAIPVLLNQLDIKDSTVSIDAIGCQKAIAKIIRDKEAHYFLSVKKNQPDLFEELSEAFASNKSIQGIAQWAYDHGRYEQRQCALLNAKEVLGPKQLTQWADLEILVQVVAQRTIKGIKTEETRYYISSDNCDKPLYFNNLSIGHWGIENHLHWHLDVTFNEDACRARTKNAPLNLSTLRKIALLKVGQMNDKKSFKKRRFKAALNDDYLLEVLKV